MLDGIMKLAAENSLKQFEVLEQVTTNIANINTRGYKARRFEQYLQSDGQISGIKRVDYSQGDLMVTNRSLDVAIKGDGFLPVTQPDGTVAYTRDGSLALNSKGEIVTQFGDLVGDGIQVPQNYQDLIIDKDGAVKARVKGQMEPVKLGQLTLTTFANPEGLSAIGNNKLVPTEAAGEPVKRTDADKAFAQGNLERANVTVFSEIDKVLRLNAGVISNLRIIKFTDDIYRQSVNLKQ